MDADGYSDLEPHSQPHGNRIAYLEPHGDRNFQPDFHQDLHRNQDRHSNRDGHPYPLCRPAF